MMIRISGNIWLSRIHPSPRRVMSPRRRASTYAAGSPIIVVTSDVITAILRLFTALRTRSASCRAVE